ncbi:MAG TPA: zinc-binding dehydrogenase [Burkholderiales bacterium]|nr:zinc-binding dehydrogenase [Burkholderiales bacterium]
MKSYWIVTNGDKASVEPREVPVPQPKAGEILMKVQASALNRGELFVGGVMHGGPEKLGGNEGAGIVHAVGPGVTAFKAGDRVMGRARGCWAEYAIIEEAQAFAVPDYMSAEEAAAAALTMLTAYEGVVTYGRLQPGEWLLILGASSGAGVACIQTAQVIGAKTIGTSGSAEKLAKLKSIGLDVGIRTRAPDFAAQVKEATGGKGADVAVNLVGGTYFPEILRALARKGRVAIVGYVDNAHHAEIDLNAVHANRFEIFGISNAKLTAAEKAEAVRGFKRDIWPGYVQKKMAPLIDRVFALDELPAAKAHMEANAMTGKIVVRIA